MHIAPNMHDFIPVHAVHTAFLGGSATAKNRSLKRIHGISNSDCKQRQLAYICNSRSVVYLFISYYM